MAEDLTAEAAMLELLDHVGEKVAVVIALPGAVPWVSCEGTLDHIARNLVHAEPDRAFSAEMLAFQDWSGHFMVGGVSIPLGEDRVLGVTRTEGLEHPGLDFEIKADGEPTGVGVRVTFTGHDQEVAS